MKKCGEIVCRYGACVSVCAGTVLIIWSFLVLRGVGCVTIGTRVDCVAWGGVVLGAVLLAFGVWRILGKERILGKKRKR